MKDVKVNDKTSVLASQSRSPGVQLCPRNLQRLRPAREKAFWEFSICKASGTLRSLREVFGGEVCFLPLLS